MSDYGARLAELVERLQSEQELEWGEVEALLSDYPHWLQIIEMLHLRAPRAPQAPAGMFMAPLDTSPVVSPRTRARLLALFHPYALLLATSLSPAERANRLATVAGVGPAAFCRERLHDANPEVVQEAKAVLEACEMRSGLLRGSDEPEESSSELLRSATSRSDTPEGELLHPSSSSASDSEPPPSGWLRRLFARRIRRETE